MPKNITRNEKENCYMVRFMRKGKKYQKNFSKKKYGGWGKAMVAAKEWRDEMVEKLPEAEMNKQGRSYCNQSGVVGVFLANNEIRRGKRTYEYWRWVAKWPDCKLRGGVTWSVNKFGEDDAFALAVLTREMRTEDREVVLKRLKRLKGTKKLKEIYAKRALMLS